MISPEDTLPILISDDHIYLKKLQDEYFFSVEEAKHLKEKMGASYREAYQFCEWDDFIKFNLILTCDANDGNPRFKLIRCINKHHESYLTRCLQGRYWYSGYQQNIVEGMIDKGRQDNCRNIIQALFNFIVLDNNQQITHYVKAINKYGNEDAGISNELDEQGLNDFILAAVDNFGAYGLTLNDLRGKEWFNRSIYLSALDNLLQEGMRVSVAIDILQSLNGEQLDQLGNKGVKVNVVTKLKYEGQFFLVEESSKNGLTLERIQSLHWVKGINSARALVMVATKEGLDKAIDILQGMTNIQFNAIVNGLNYVDILKLNDVQIEALTLLRSAGLTTQHLIDKKWFTCPYHKDVLVYLIKKMNFNINNALYVMDNTNWLQIINIMKSLCSLKFENLNQYHIIALLKLNKFGLESNHLMGCAWFNSIKHCDYLACLMCLEQKEPQEAINILRGCGNQFVLEKKSPSKFSTRRT